MLPHVVRAQDRGAALVSENGSSEARGRAPRFRLGITQDLAERALAGDADENRAAKCRQLVEPAQELEVVLDSLAEADPGVEADQVLADPLRDREAEPVIEEVDDIVDRSEEHTSELQSQSNLVCRL